MGLCSLLSKAEKLLGGVAAGWRIDIEDLSERIHPTSTAGATCYNGCMGSTGLEVLQDLHVLHALQVLQVLTVNTVIR